MRKRAVERIHSDLNAEFYWSDKVHSGMIADISENGMLLNSDTCPPMRAKFDLTIPTEGESFTVPVKVRRLVKNDHVIDAVGLEVMHAPKRYLDFIDELRWGSIKGISVNGQAIKVYVCTVCHHISFDHAPINCPICSSTIESFEKAPGAIKKPDNFTELSEFEKKHFPVISISKRDRYVDAHITVGNIKHEMDIDDHIAFIDCYFNDAFINKKCVSRVNFNCERMVPSATLRFNDISSGVLTVISNCSAHGNWLAKINI